MSYRARSAVRDAAKALGHSPGQVDAWAKRIERWGSLGQGHHPSAPHRKDRWTWWSAAAEREAAERSAARTAAGPGGAGRPGRDDVAAEPGPEEAVDELGIPPRVLAVATELEGFPRHLGIHPGGMVICDRPVAEVCPVEWARMEHRTVLQWDKDDCAAAGLVKFDLLGLGMLEAIHRAVDTVAACHGVEVDLALVPQEDEVYDLLCRGDSVGLFQVESRAQMATLPRLQPRCFYDLVVEVALIRPGPIQGGSVHPYLRRRSGAEEVTYVHPSFERSLKKTLGVPLFQEQLMQMAIDAAGFTRVRGRPAAPGNGLQAVGRADGAAPRPAVRGHGGPGDRRRDGGRGLGAAGRLRQLRLPREPLGLVRLPRLRERLVEAALPGRLPRRAARTRSRWASGRRTPSWPTPVGTGSSCSAPTSTRARRRPRSSRPATAPPSWARAGRTPRRRSASASPR